MLSTSSANRTAFSSYTCIVVVLLQQGVIMSPPHMSPRIVCEKLSGVGTLHLT